METFPPQTLLVREELWHMGCRFLGLRGNATSATVFRAIDLSSTGQVARAGRRQGGGECVSNLRRDGANIILKTRLWARDR